MSSLRLTSAPEQCSTLVAAPPAGQAPSEATSNERSLLSARDFSATAQLTHPETDIVLVRRTLSPEVGALAEALCRATSAGERRVPLRTASPDPAVLDALLEGLPAPLSEQIRRDAVFLGGRWSQLTGRPQCRVTLSVVTSDQCRKLHRDNLDLRLVCTYAGPGTLLVPESALDRRALGDDAEAHEANPRICTDALAQVQAAVGDVAFMKGRRWRGGARGAIHRSPTIEATGERRLLLMIDGVDCEP